jgi:hypothetical protein
LFPISAPMRIQNRLTWSAPRDPGCIQRGPMTAPKLGHPRAQYCPSPSREHTLCHDIAFHWTTSNESFEQIILRRINTENAQEMLEALIEVGYVDTEKDSIETNTQESATTFSRSKLCLTYRLYSAKYLTVDYTKNGNSNQRKQLRAHHIGWDRKTVRPYQKFRTTHSTCQKLRRGKEWATKSPFNS